MLKIRSWARAGLFMLLALVLSVGGLARVAAQPNAPATLIPRAYLPYVTNGYACPTTSGNSYYQNIVYQEDRDWPVRPAYNHADKNFSLRGYIPNLIDAESLQSGQSDPLEPNRPPQLGTIFNPDRTTSATAGIVNVYRAYLWNWGTSPAPGTRGGEDSNPTVGVLGLSATPGEILQTPTSFYQIVNGQYQAFVMYADADTIAIHYSAEDTASLGYTVHVDNICTDPNLLALYNQLDNPSGARYTHQPYSGWHGYSYNMPYLALGQTFGTARYNEILVKVVDSGGTVEPRSCWNFWHWTVPGANGPCQ